MCIEFIWNLTNYEKILNTRNEYAREEKNDSKKKLIDASTIKSLIKNCENVCANAYIWSDHVSPLTCQNVKIIVITVIKY